MLVQGGFFACVGIFQKRTNVSTVVEKISEMASLAEKIKMILWGGDMEPLRKIMVLSFMALNLHQFEEYAMPGGFPMVMNRAFMGETEVPERFPLNKRSAFVCNVLLMYPLYLLAIVFCQQIWLGLTMVITGVAQIFVHGIAFNRKRRKTGA